MKKRKRNNQYIQKQYRKGIKNRGGERPRKDKQQQINHPKLQDRD